MVSVSVVKSRKWFRDDDATVGRNTANGGRALEATRGAQTWRTTCPWASVGCPEGSVVFNAGIDSNNSVGAGRRARDKRADLADLAGRQCGGRVDGLARGRVDWQ